MVPFLSAQPWAGPILACDPAALGVSGLVPLALLEAAGPRAPELTLTFAGAEGPDAFGLPGTAPFDADDVAGGGGMHGGLHRRERATLLLMRGAFRRGAVVRDAVDLTDIAPTLLHLLGLEAAGSEGRVLRAA